VLAPAAKWRRRIVPESTIESAAQQDTLAAAEATTSSVNIAARNVVGAVSGINSFRSSF
jgi:hypothetical protein